MPHCTDFIKFSLGAKVRIVMGRDIEGFVKSYLITEWSNPGIRYEVGWIHNGESKSSWFFWYELILHENYANL